MPNLISSALLSGLPGVSSIAQPASSKEPAVAALPIGGRVKFDLWDNSLELLKSQPVGLMSSREKTPFEVTAFMPNLTRVGDANPGAGRGVGARRGNTKNHESAQTNP